MTVPKLDQSQGAGVKAPIHKHASETARSKEDAGGEVPVSDYANKAPGLPNVRR
jgi:hypothetical protein